MLQASRTFAVPIIAKKIIMVDLKSINSDDFEVIEAPKRGLKPVREVWCTFFRVKQGDYRPSHSNLTITDMPKELYDAYFQFRSPSEGRIEL